MTVEGMIKAVHSFLKDKLNILKSRSLVEQMQVFRIYKKKQKNSVVLFVVLHRIGKVMSKTHIPKIIIFGKTLQHNWECVTYSSYHIYEHKIKILQNYKIEQDII